MESKIKLLKVLDILSKTDENHPITASKICTLLESEGEICERKSICRDINTLIRHGYKITLCHDNKLGYYMQSDKKAKTPERPASPLIKITLVYDVENEDEVTKLFGKPASREESGEVKAEFSIEENLLYTKLIKAGEIARITEPESIRKEFISQIEKTIAFYNKPRGDKKIEVWLL